MFKFLDRELGKKYKDGELIFKQGDPAESMFVIQRGQVESVLKTELGEHRLNVYNEGETFGETSLFAGKARFSTTRALGQARILKIDRNTFMSMLHRDQALSFRVIRQLALRVYELDHEFISNLYEQHRYCELTGLPKYPDATKLLEGEVRRAKMMMQSLTFAVLDLDNSKAIQDTHGEVVLHQVLKALSDILLKHLRKTDFIGRYGRDQFPVILYEADNVAALKVINAVREEFARFCHSGEGAPFFSTFSAGIATFPHYNDSELLRKAAMEALRAGKEGGRNLVVLAEQETLPVHELTPEETTPPSALNWMRRQSMNLFGDRKNRKKS